MGHAIEPSTTVAYVCRQHMRQKKDVVYGLLFVLHEWLHRSFDLQNPIENPYLYPNLYLIKILSKNKLKCNSIVIQLVNEQGNSLYSSSGRQAQ